MLLVSHSVPRVSQPLPCCIGGYLFIVHIDHSTSWASPWPPPLPMSKVQLWVVVSDACITKVAIQTVQVNNRP